MVSSVILFIRSFLRKLDERTLKQQDFCFLVLFFATDTANEYSSELVFLIDHQKKMSISMFFFDLMMG